MAHIYVYSGAVGSGTGANWTNAYTTITAALAAAGTVAGDNIWVAHNHAEAPGSGTAITWTDVKGTPADPVKIICVNSAGTVPPVSADLRTTATLTTTGAAVISLGTTATRAMYVYGITFSAGSGAVTANISLHTASGSHSLWEQCAFRQASTSANNISVGSITSWATFKNCTVQFGATNHSLVLIAPTIWDGGSITGAAIPSTVLGTSGASSSARLFRNFDFSAATSGKSLANPVANRVSFVLENCKIDAAVTICTRSTGAGGNVTLIRTDSAETGYRTAIIGEYAGDMTTSVVVARTNGASDGVTKVSWKFETTANSEWLIPLNGLPLWKFNDTIDEAIDITVEGVADPRNFSALPTNKDFWIDLSYQGTSGSSLGLTQSGTSNFIDTGTAHTASTEAWDSAATARANSTAYALGDVIKVASNAGRIFICTTAGTTAGSEPAGYASAVDGGSVTDNTATFKAGWRFKQTLSVTPVAVGAIQAIPRLAKASSVIYLDPKLVIAGLISYLMTEGGDFLTDGVTQLLAG